MVYPEDDGSTLASCVGREDQRALGWMSSESLARFSLFLMVEESVLRVFKKKY